MPTKKSTQPKKTMRELGNASSGGAGLAVYNRRRVAELKKERDKIDGVNSLGYINRRSMLGRNPQTPPALKSIDERIAFRTKSALEAEEKALKARSAYKKAAKKRGK